METSQSERRRWERYPVNLRTKITINCGGETSSFFGEATDLSHGGLKLFMPRDVAAGIIVLVELAFPYNARSVALRGMIRNRAGFSYGIEFIRINKHEQEIIDLTCKALQLLK